MAPRNTWKIAKQHINTLFNLAQETVHTDPERAKRYIKILRSIAQRNRIHLPPEVRWGICRKCDTILIQGLNSHTRIKQKREPHIAVTCHTCGNITRRPVRNRI